MAMEGTGILRITIFAILILLATTSAYGGEFKTRVPMQDKGVSTYYVKAHIDGVGATDFMVDTGSGYTTIDEHTLATLKAQGRARYVKDLLGILADGSQTVVPVYLIPGIVIGGECLVDNVEAAVFPGKTRHILGLSTLRKLSPFVFSMDPPSLLLSNCSPSSSEALLGMVERPRETD
jgi:Predicted aspartyl protease